MMPRLRSCSAADCSSWLSRFFRKVVSTSYRSLSGAMNSQSFLKE